MRRFGKIPPHPPLKRGGILFTDKLLTFYEKTLHPRFHRFHRGQHPRNRRPAPGEVPGGRSGRWEESDPGWKSRSFAFGPDLASVMDEEWPASSGRTSLRHPTRILSGMDGLMAVATHPAGGDGGFALSWAASACSHPGRRARPENIWPWPTKNRWSWPERFW